jgi:VanZ family protein
MPERLKHDKGAGRWLPAGIWGVLILFASVLPCREIPSLAPGYSDKIAHFCGYMIFAVLCFRAASGKTGIAGRRIPLFALILTFSYGILMELLQCLIPGRDASLLDIVFNFGGASSGILLGKVIKWRK